MSVVTQNEREFTSKYLQLINLSENARLDQFYSTSDYGKLSSLGPTLPKIDVPLPRGKTSANSDSASTIQVSLKSIKPPFKFSTQLQLPASHTVYKVKSDLIGTLLSLKDTGVKAADVKLLVKGKVMQDTSSLSTIVNGEQELSFMCMVSQPSVAEPDVAADPSDDKIEEVTPVAASNDRVVISPDAWFKIRKVLVEDLANEQKADQALTKLKSTFN